MSEFRHYTGCKYKDPENCSGCALTQGGEEGPNYAAWPLCYIERGHIIPAKWKRAFERERQSENRAYAQNLENKIKELGALFSDGTRVTS